MPHEPVSQTPSVRVMVVALPLVAWGLERLVESARPSLDVCGIAPSAQAALLLAQEARPDVIVVDLDAQTEADAVKQLSAQTQAKVLAITASGDMAVLDGAVLAGARGVVEKKESPATFLKAIEKVHQGEIWVDRNATGRLFVELARQKTAQQSSPEQTRIASLSRRERQAITALMKDASLPGKTVAERLNISEHTLRNHLTSIYDKLGVASRMELYAYALRHGLDRA